MKDPFLHAASGANWISSAITIIQDIMNGPTSHFAVPGVTEGGPNRRAIRKLLRRRGVTVWGMLFSPDLSMLMFSVRKRQAQKTYDALDQSGIPIIQAPSGIDASSNRQPSGKSKLFDW